MTLIDIADVQDRPPAGDHIGLSIYDVVQSSLGEYMFACARSLPDDATVCDLLADAVDAFCSTDSAQLATVIADANRDEGWTVAGLFQQARPHNLLHAVALDPAGIAYDFLGAHSIDALAAPFASAAGPLVLRGLAPQRVDRAPLLRQIATALPWVPSRQRASTAEMIAALRLYLADRPTLQ